MALRPGDSQGDGWGARERDLQDPLCLFLLVLFLPLQEKYRQNLRKRNAHLQCSGKPFFRSQITSRLPSSTVILACFPVK